MEFIVKSESDYAQYLTSLETINIKILYWEIKKEIPSLPSSLTILYCGDNRLTLLPSLPSSLTYLDCHNNPFLFFPEDIPRLGIRKNVNKVCISWLLKA